MNYKCTNCDNEFEIKRPDRRFTLTELLIKTGTGLNMAYVGHMNRDYALCPSCGVMEDQLSAEARDQSEPCPLPFTFV